jgi:hypothetical protein
MLTLRVDTIATHSRRLRMQVIRRLCDFCMTAARICRLKIAIFVPLCTMLLEADILVFSTTLCTKA